MAQTLKLSKTFGAALLAAAAAAPALAASPTDVAACLRAQPVEFPGTIVDAAIATPDLSTLVSLVVAANLTGPLSGPGPLTVFAPTNAAFAKVPSALLGAIGSDIGLLTGVLTYHVSPGTVDPRRAALIREVETLQGQTLFIQNEGGTMPMINQSTTSCTAVKTTNGTVWIIDSVLLPQAK